MNGYYLSSYLKTNWSSKIANVTWKVAGYNEKDMVWDYYDYSAEENVNMIYAGIEQTSSSSTPRTIYNNEIANPTPGSYGNSEINYKGKIGLLYLSDYGFANTNWSEFHNAIYYNPKNNWLDNFPTLDYSITRYSGNNNLVYSANGITWCLNGVQCDEAYNEDLDSYNSLTVRPVFYLKSSVQYMSGSGTINDPFIIS